MYLSNKQCRPGECRSYAFFASRVASQLSNVGRPNAGRSVLRRVRLNKASILIRQCWEAKLDYKPLIQRRAMDGRIWCVTGFKRLCQRNTTEIRSWIPLLQSTGSCMAVGLEAMSPTPKTLGFFKDPPWILYLPPPLDLFSFLLALIALL